MTILAMVVIVSWAWMLATSLHVDDLRTDVRRSSNLVRRPAEVASDRTASRPHLASLSGGGRPAG
jgi:hypothetical protein